MKRTGWTVLSTIVIATAIGGMLSAQTKPAKPAETVNKKAAKNAAKGAAIDANREAELLAFVREHHAELAALLDQLKPMSPVEYQAALRDLDRDVRRLENLRKRSADQSEAEIQLWKSRSRIRLLAARMTMSDDDEVRLQLKDQLRELRLLELAAVQRDIDAARQAIDKQQKKLQQLERRATELQSTDDGWIERKLTALERENRPQEKETVKPKKPGKSKPKAEATGK